MLNSFGRTSDPGTGEQGMHHFLPTKVPNCIFIISMGHSCDRLFCSTCSARRDWPNVSFFFFFFLLTRRLIAYNSSNCNEACIKSDWCSTCYEVILKCHQTRGPSTALFHRSIRFPKQKFEMLGSRSRDHLLKWDFSRFSNREARVLSQPYFLFSFWYPSALGLRRRRFTREQGFQRSSVTSWTRHAVQIVIQTR